MTLNPLPWPIADDMDVLKINLEDIITQIELLDRPVPPMAVYRARSMRLQLDIIIKSGEASMKDVA